MISLLLAAGGAAAAFAVRYELRRSGRWTRRETRAALLRGAGIVVVRAGLFWTALALYGRADYWQVVGYVLLSTNTLLETALAASLRPSGSFFALLVVLLLIPTSFGLAFPWALLQRRRADRRADSVR